MNLNSITDILLINEWVLTDRYQFQLTNKQTGDLTLKSWLNKL